MNAAFAVLAWATLAAVYLEACMSLADRWHHRRNRRNVVDLRPKP